MIAIEIEDLWKEYRLGVIGHGTLSQDLQSWWARIRGKDDPNSKLPIFSIGLESQIDGNRFWALRDVNMSIQQGEVVGIIGRNGAGKSTLLKILSRVTAPTRGKVRVKGRIASLLEVGTGFHPELTGRENIFMNGAILGMSRKEISDKLEEIIEFSGIGKFTDTPVKRYSSGMHVRLAFAVAAHLEPEILVVDEVLAVGDAAFQKKCLGKMHDISNEGRTVLFVSHNMAAVSSLCSRSVLLENGRLIQEGRTSDIVLSYYASIADVKKMSQNLIGDDTCQLEKVSINKANGGNAQEVGLGDEIRISIYYNIAKNIEDLCVPNVHLQTASGQYVCAVNAPNVKPMSSGSYCATCVIPPYLLNEGAYSIGVAVTSYKNSGESFLVHFYEKNILSFNVIDKKIKDFWNYGFTSTVPGIIRPRFAWSIKKIGEV